MVNSHDRIQSLFLAAVEMPERERCVFLGQECGGERHVYGRVIELLRAHEQTGSFLDHRPAWSGTTAKPSEAESVDGQVGPYKLREKIGEGGMGIVFVAEQSLEI